MNSTKRLYLLPQDDDFAMSDLSGQLDAPLCSVSVADLHRMDALQLDSLENSMPALRPASGTLVPRCAPIREGVPDIPERPTVTVERSGYRKPSPASALAGLLNCVRDILFGVGIAAMITGVVVAILRALGGIAR